MASRPRKEGRKQTRRQSPSEAAVSDGMMAFQHDFVGRGPDRIRTRITDDMVIVRSSGVLTPAERHLVETPEGRETVKELRRRIVEVGHDEMFRIVREKTGIPALEVFSDISTETGEWMLVFVLEQEFGEDSRDR